MGGIFNNSDKYVIGTHREGAGETYTLESVLARISKDVILPTVLRVGKEELDYWTNMTCFYDKYWEFDPKLSTVPIAFMHITSVAETIIAQGAEKRVIIYESPTTDQSEAGFVPGVGMAYKNNLEVIMDNVVVQPKQYQMEVIIPDSLIGPFHQQGMNRLSALLDHMSMTDAIGSNIFGLDLAKGMSRALQTAQVFVDTINKAADLFDKILGAGAGSSQIATMNKNSVEAMAKKGRVVLFKKWTGYDYSYGLITKIDISKKPTEDGVYRGSITFQEAPILNISKKKMSTAASIIGGAANYTVANMARVLNLTLAWPFLKVTGVMEEAGAPNSDPKKMI